MIVLATQIITLIKNHEILLLQVLILEKERLDGSCYQNKLFFGCLIKEKGHII